MSKMWEWPTTEDRLRVSWAVLPHNLVLGAVDKFTTAILCNSAFYFLVLALRPDRRVLFFSPVV